MKVRFVVLNDFYSEETESQYLTGLGYMARTEHLQALVPTWVKEGKVKIIPTTASGESLGAVGGSGVVS